MKKIAAFLGIVSFVSSAWSQVPQLELVTNLANATGHPNAALIEGPDGVLYGTTTGGQIGTVFKVTKAGSLTTLVNFTGANGSSPESGGVTFGSDGALYGTTEHGGNFNFGTVFRVTTNGAFGTLVHFNRTNGAGASPRKGGLTIGPDGDLYGTTFDFNNVYYFGTIFKISPPSSFTSVAGFTNDNISGIPEGRLTLGSDNNFYCGNIARIIRVTTSGQATPIAVGPSSIEGLTFGLDGALYGVHPDAGVGGRGAMFRVTTEGVRTTVVDFGVNVGEDPWTRLVLAPDGSFYGTTIHGGSGREGTVFHVTTNGAITTLASFNRTNSFGWGPYGGLLLASDGYLYGTTMFGGAANGGVIYRLGLAPSIYKQPVSRTNVAGTSATFTVAASGTKTLAYQWMHNGNNLIDGGDVFGANTEQLILSNVQLEDAGEISVMVTNAYGTATSEIAWLEVIPLDSDGDSVLDGQDQCPGTPLGVIVNEHGCSITQLVPCSGPISGGEWKNHGQFVGELNRVVNEFLSARLITRLQAAEISKAGSQSDCGKKK